MRLRRHFLSSAVGNSGRLVELEPEPCKFDYQRAPFLRHVCEAGQPSHSGE
jgi:hypothetical protein